MPRLRWHARTRKVDPPLDYCAERTAMMPKRARTRAQDCAARIATQRRHNREARQSKGQQRQEAYFGPAPPGNGDDEPPPF